MAATQPSPCPSEVLSEENGFAFDLPPKQGTDARERPRAGIRKLELDDESAFIQLAEESAAFHEQWIKAPRDPETYRQYLSRFDDESSKCFAVYDIDSQLIVGFISLTGIEREPYHRGRLGYGIFKPYARMGYTSAALANVVSHAFGELDLHRLEADIQPKNIPSKQLIRKMGFTFECISRGFIRINGVWTDHERWAITADEWSIISPHL